MVLMIQSPFNQKGAQVFDFLSFREGFLEKH
jgi:hypothetical protein